MAQAGPGWSQATKVGFGSADLFGKPEPLKARPKPWLWGQAGPEHHYVRARWCKAEACLSVVRLMLQSLGNDGSGGG